MDFGIIKDLKLKIREKFNHRDDVLALLMKYAYCLFKDGVPGLKEIYRRYPLIKESYASWRASCMAVSFADRAKISKHINSMKRKPLISILIPVRDADETLLRKAAESALDQLYPRFELRVACDASSQSRVRAALGGRAAKDSRVNLIFPEAGGRMSELSDSALKTAKGEFVAILNEDDELTEDALYHIADAISQNPEANLIYSDEDKMDIKGNLSRPYFKPDWSPDLIRSHNFISHLAAYRRSVVEKAGGFRKDREGAHEWDLCLRVADLISADSIVHVPRALYHFRTARKSAPVSSRAVEAGIKAVRDSLRRNREAGAPNGDCEPLKTPKGAVRTRYELSREPLVSLIILTRDKLDLLKQCVESILRKTAYKNYEIIIVDNGSVEKQTLSFLKQIGKNPKIKVVRRDVPFNFSQLNNEAVSLAKGEIIGLINNDIEVIEPDWLREMASHAARPKIGAVGAKLLYPDNRVQHAGMITGLGKVAGHAHRGAAANDAGHGGRLKLIHNVSAVTGACLLIRKKIYLEVGGLEESLKVACNDVDFCLKVKEAGYLNLYAPYAELRHYESKTRGYEDTPSKKARYDREAAYMKKRWGALLRYDPYYNPNLTLRREDFSLAANPRTPRPWKNI